MLDWRKLVGAYRIDLENRDFLLANQTDASYLSFSEIPELVDPRNSELWGEGWLRTENQGQIGSCFKLGSLVKLEDGTEKPIEQITLDDIVISHTGNSRRVNYLFRNKYTGYMYTIYIQGYSRPITVTASHNFLKENPYSNEYSDDKFIKVKAEELSEDDFMYLNTISSSKEYTTIDLAQFLPNTAIVDIKTIKLSTRTPSIPRYLELDEDLGWLIGFYLAEGYTVSDKQIRFATHAKESEFHNKIEKLMLQKFGLTLKVLPDKRPNNFYQYCQNKTLATVLKNMLGKNCYSKKIPKEFLGAPHSFKLNLIKGWLAGDGSEKDINSTGYTTSKDLANAINSIALNIGLNPCSSSQSTRKGNRKDQTIIRFNKNDILSVANYNVDLSIFDRKEPSGIALISKNKIVKEKVTDSLVRCKIKKIEKEYVENETVYNLEVDVDHTVIVNGIAAFQCQGNALTENCEYCYATATGKVEQFSRMFAYLVSQMYDNIRGDSGSTLSGGTKAIREKGLCRESIAPYPNSYPGHSWVTDEMYKDAQKYKLLSYTDMKSSDQVKAFIGSGIGIVQIGIAWNGSMEPDSNGCIKSWSSGGGGGHSVTFTGYLPDELVGARSSKGWWLLLKNSWGTRWGRGGFAYVDPAACDQMLRHQWTVMLGRSDMETPEPRPVHIDFTKPDNMSIR